MQRKANGSHVYNSLCLEQDYESVLKRLSAMEIMPKPEDGFKQKVYDLGKLANTNTAAQAATLG